MTMAESIEKHSIKISIGVAITVIIFLIIMTANFASWKAAMEAEHDSMMKSQVHMEEGLQTLKVRLYALEDENTDFKVQLATIDTKLASIETLLLEIRQDLKEDR